MGHRVVHAGNATMLRLRENRAILKPMIQTDVRTLQAVAGGSKADTVAALRARMQAMETAPEVAEEEVVETFTPLDNLLPTGGLPRHQAIQCAPCPMFVAELIAHLSARGGHVGVVGWPLLSFAHIADSGDASKVVAVPDPGPDPWQVATVLAEGLDLVVLHGPAGELSPTRARPILAKLRGGQACVLSVGPRLPGTPTAIDAAVHTYRGIGRGTGRIAGLDIAVRVRSKGHRDARGTITCGARRRLAAV